jgi:stage V sporulation protein S
MVDEASSKDTILRVKSGSSAPALASAISHGVYDGKQVVLRAIGAGAVNQAAKAMAIAQSFVGPRGISLVFRPGFTTVTMPDGEITALVFRVIPT